MAKVIKMKNHQKDDEDKIVEEFVKILDYETLTKNLKDKEKKLLKTLGIVTTKDLLDFISMFGFSNHGKLGSLKNLFDNYDSISPEEDEEEEDEEDDYYDDEEENDEDEEDDEYYDPDYIPKGLFIKKGLPAKEYHIRIKLNNAPVKIWRELKVPSNMSLELLAQFLIIAMGWDNAHLHQFRKNDTYYLNTAQMKQDEDMFGFWGFQRSINADKTALSEVLASKGTRIKFEYDFGDSWEHDVWVKGIREYEKDEEPKVVFVKGQGACPPEDCGGVWGYEELLELRTKKRKSADDKERLEWYELDDPDFKPEECDEEWINDDVEDYWAVIQEAMKKK